MKQKAEKEAEKDKKKASDEVNEVRQKANHDIVEIKQKTITDLNSLKVKANNENEELKKQICTLDSENLVLTESNILANGKADHVRKEYGNYKADAE